MHRYARKAWATTRGSTCKFCKDSWRFIKWTSSHLRKTCKIFWRFTRRAERTVRPHATRAVLLLNYWHLVTFLVSVFGTLHAGGDPNLMFDQLNLHLKIMFKMN